MPPSKQIKGVEDEVGRILAALARWYDPPKGYFGCRACDEEWVRVHPEEREEYDEVAGKWI